MWNKGESLRIVVAVAGLLALVVAAYWQAPGNVFHFDDDFNIVDHKPVHISELTPSAVLEAGFSGVHKRRVLPNMSFAIDWWRGDGDPRPFQWTNLVLHGIASCLVFGFFLICLRRFDQTGMPACAGAFLGAAVWSVHPIQVQAVTYIVQRMAEMAALFTVLTVLCYVMARTSTRGWVRWAMLAAMSASFICAVGSKENALVAPVLILLAEYGIVRHRQPLIRHRIDYGLLALPVIIAAYVAIDIASGMGPLARAFLPEFENRDFTLEQRLLTQPRVIAFHFSQIVWPLPGRFSLEHDFSLSRGLMAPPSTAVALAGLLVWCALGVWALFRQHWRVVGFFLLWVPATLAIESSFVPLEMVFEHRMYLPTVGLGGLLACGLAQLLDHPRGRPAAIALVLALPLSLAVLTGFRIPIWASPIELARNSVAHAPNSARAWSNLGNAYKNVDRWAEAEVAVRRALELDPDEPRSLHILGVRMMDKGDLQEAKRHIEKRIALGKMTHYVLNTLGELRLKQGDADAAIRSFRHALAIEPATPVYHWNLAVALERNDECGLARRHWKSYIELETEESSRTVVRRHLTDLRVTPDGRCAD